jgi:hypothetical protein
MPFHDLTVLNFAASVYKKDEQKKPGRNNNAGRTQEQNLPASRVSSFIWFSYCLISYLKLFKPRSNLKRAYN